MASSKSEQCIPSITACENWHDRPCIYVANGNIPSKPAGPSHPDPEAVIDSGDANHHCLTNTLTYETLYDSVLITVQLTARTTCLQTVSSYYPTCS